MPVRLPHPRSEPCRAVPSKKKRPPRGLFCKDDQLLVGIEPTLSSLPMTCFTTKLQQPGRADRNPVVVRSRHCDFRSGGTADDSSALGNAQQEPNHVPGRGSPRRRIRGYARAHRSRGRPRRRRDRRRPLRDPLPGSSASDPGCGAVRRRDICLSVTPLLRDDRRTRPASAQRCPNQLGTSPKSSQRHDGRGQNRSRNDDADRESRNTPRRHDTVSSLERARAKCLDR